MKVLVLLVCIGISLAEIREYKIYDIERAEEYFEDFIQTYNKHYANKIEKSKRFNIFVENLKIINNKNEKSKTAVFAINKFTDLTNEEFLQTYTGLSGSSGDGCKIQNQTSQIKSAPESFDWREKKVVTKIKDQGRCGSCWAFGATGNLEGQYAIKHKKLIELSEQQLVDCDEKSSGCDGASRLQDAHLYWLKAGAISEQDYPYEATDNNCRYDEKKVKVKTSECHTLQVPDEEQLKEVLFNVGPLTIGLDASSMQYYNGGVLEDCSFQYYNHALLLVGYGSDKQVPYWVIKNSWGTSFGEAGYVRIRRGVDACGIQDSEKVTSILA